MELYCRVLNKNTYTFSIILQKCCIVKTGFTKIHSIRRVLVHTRKHINIGKACLMPYSR